VDISFGPTMSNIVCKYTDYPPRHPLVTLGLLTGRGCGLTIRIYPGENISSVDIPWVDLMIFGSSQRL
jgi:hypothetical protein